MLALQNHQAPKAPLYILVTRSEVTDLLRLLGVVPIEKVDFHQAPILPTDDFEDAVQAAAALKIGGDYIVTRDEKGFGGLSIPPVNAGAILSLL